MQSKKDKVVEMPEVIGTIEGIKMRAVTMNSTMYYMVPRLYDNFIPYFQVGDKVKIEYFIDTCTSVKFCKSVVMVQKGEDNVLHS